MTNFLRPFVLLVLLTACANPRPLGPTPASTVTIGVSTPSPTVTAPNSAVGSESNTAVAPIVCNQFEAHIDIRQATNNQSRQLMDIVWEAENEITFLMWSDRPEPELLPTAVVTPVSEGGGPPYPLAELNQSSRVLLTGQTWNWADDSLVETPVTTDQPKQTPCSEQCPLEVVGISPDHHWQLLQITDAPVEHRGMWLVSQDAILNVVPYVPVSSHWRWSTDSQTLWITYTLQDISGETYGAESAVVDLSGADSPRIHFRSWEATGYLGESPPTSLSPDEYKLVFSPTDKVVLLYEHIGSPSLAPANNELDLYIVDISQNPPQISDSDKVRYPFFVDWSDILQEFIVVELNTTEAIIYRLNSDIVYEIPIDVFQKISINSLQRVSISPNQQNIILTSSTNAWVYACLD